MQAANLEPSSAEIQVEFVPKITERGTAEIN